MEEHSLDDVTQVMDEADLDEPNASQDEDEGGSGLGKILEGSVCSLQDMDASIAGKIFV